MSLNDSLDVKIIIDQEKEREINGKFLVLGFHGIGNVGHLSIRYLVETALKNGKGKKIGYILSRYMPPFVEVLSNGHFGTPYELFSIGNAIFLLIRIQPTLEEQATLADVLANFAKEKGVSGIILTGGIDVNAFPSEEIPPAVYVANEQFKSIMKNKQWSLEPAPKDILITGGVALFLIYASHYNVPAIAIFSPTEKGVVNTQSALSLSKLLVEMLELPLDLSELESMVEFSAEEMFKKVRDQIKELEEFTGFQEHDSTEEFSTFT